MGPAGVGLGVLYVVGLVGTVAGAGVGVEGTEGISLSGRGDAIGGGAETVVVGMGAVGLGGGPAGLLGAAGAIFLSTGGW